MKKKLFIACCCFLFLLILILFKGPFTFKITGNIPISRPIDEVAAQFTDLKNWPHWHPDLAGKNLDSLHYSETTGKINSYIETSGGRQFTLTAVNPAGIVFKESFKNKNGYQSLIAVPDSMGRTTRVYGIRFVSAWDWMKENISPQNKIKRELQSLKLFVENPFTFYGFPIEIRPVSDSLIMTGQMIIPAGTKNPPFQLIYQELTDYARANKLLYKTYWYMSLKATDSGNIRVAVGIPVNKRGPARKDIKFLEMPIQGRLLVGNTTGSPARIKELYVSMEKYMKDKNLKRVADPLEKYEYFPVSAEDSLHINVEVQIPIY
ncbi:MAG TPA: hypothetical protein VFC34_13310 [Puia sp.]|nr:hypothetical protein [Puia sp.]